MIEKAGVGHVVMDGPAIGPSRVEVSLGRGGCGCVGKAGEGPGAWLVTWKVLATPEESWERFFCFCFSHLKMSQNASLRNKNF